MLYSFEDLSIFFADFGTKLTWQGRQIDCIFGEKSDPLAFQAGGRDISATVKTRDIPGMVSGQAVTVNNRSYLVAEIQRIQDGEMCKLLLEESV